MKLVLTSAIQLSLSDCRLYDGRVLCELMNEIEEGAVPQEVSLVEQLSVATIG